jgi:hypothetical protein
VKVAGAFSQVPAPHQAPMLRGTFRAHFSSVGFSCRAFARPLAIGLCTTFAYSSSCSGSIGANPGDGGVTDGQFATGGAAGGSTGNAGRSGAAGGIGVSGRGGADAGNGGQADGGDLGSDATVDGGGSGGGSPVVCSQFSSGQQVGTLFDGPTETSGIVASRKQDDVLWVHEDAGASPVLYAISTAGTLLGQWRIQTTSRVYDWEDIAIESMTGRADRIWVGDVGDNGVRDGETPRASIHIARIPEPTVDRTIAPGSNTTITNLQAEDTFTFTYPNTAYDSEAIAVDPQTGDLYIFAKVGTGPSSVFRARAPLSSGVLEVVAALDATSLNGADFSPAGDELLVRNYASAFYFARSSGTWPEALALKPKTVRLQGEAAAEAIGFAADGRGFFTISEGANSPILFYAKTCK